MQKKITLSIISIVFFIAIQAQTKVKFDEIIKVDSKYNATKELDLNATPTNPEFIIINSEWIDGLMKDFTYWDEMYESTFINTLYIYQKNSIDSVLKVQNKMDSYGFLKVKNEWYVQNFDITSTNITLRHVAVGLTSKQVYKLLGKKAKIPVGNGQIWICNKSKTKRLILTFTNDKVTLMHY